MTQEEYENTFRLQKVSFVEDSHFEVELRSSSGEIIHADCFVYDEVVRRFVFEPEEFDKAIFLGRIYVRPICRIVSLFHDIVKGIDPKSDVENGDVPNAGS